MLIAHQVIWYGSFRGSITGTVQWQVDAKQLSGETRERKAP